jgi:hypothetical protein
MWKPDRVNYDFYELANIRPRIHGAASLLASNIIHGHRVEHLSDAEIVSRTLAEVMEFEPRAGDVRVLHADVHHIPMAMPCPFPTQRRTRPARGHVRPGLVRISSAIHQPKLILASRLERESAFASASSSSMRFCL